MVYDPPMVRAHGDHRINPLRNFLLRGALVLAAVPACGSSDDARPATTPTGDAGVNGDTSASESGAPSVNVGEWRPDVTLPLDPAHGLWGANADFVLAVGEAPGGGAARVVSRKLRGGAKSWDVEFDAADNHPFRAISGTGPSDIIVAGNVAIRFNGTEWKELPKPPAAVIGGLWSRGVNDVFAAGYSSGVLHWDGSAWAVVHATSGAGVVAVWGTGSDVFAVGSDGKASTGGFVARFDGKTWTDTPVVTSVDGFGFTGVWGTSPTNVHAVGARGIAFHYDGVAWTQQGSPVKGVLRGIWGSGAADVFAAGLKPSFVRFDGVSWAADTTTATKDFYAVWGSGPSDIWAIAGDGELAHRTP